MKISNKGLELIKRFEGCRLAAYQDSGGVWTIGYGHTKGVKKGQTITQEQANSFLVEDCGKAESRVNKYQSKYNFNQNQYDALVSFAFNIGSIDKLTINGTRTIPQISEKIPVYCKCAGKKLQGLLDRRTAEKELFDSPVEVERNEEVKKECGYMFECPVLGGGMKGNAVLLWQKLLAGCGYDLGEDGRAGNLSGEFNAGTYLATLDYKKHVGISIGADGKDGRVTEEVWKCMIGL